MTYIPIDSADHQPGKPVVGAGGWAEQINENLGYIHGLLGSLQSGEIPNGSFEIDTNSDGVPDLWTRSLYPGGSGARDAVSPQHGAACIKLVHPGGASNGGGYFESEYVACTPDFMEIISLIHWSSVLGIHNRIEVSYYTAAKVPISTQIIYDSVTTPISATRILTGFTPPTTARFYKLRLIGGITDVDVAGSSYFDGVTRIIGTNKHTDSTDFTGGVATSNSTSWVFAGSSAVNLNASNLPLILSLTSWLKSDALGYPGRLRWKVGAVYSNTVEVDSASYVAAICTLSLPAGQGTITLERELQAVSGAGAIISTYIDTPARMTIDESAI